MTYDWMDYEICQGCGECNKGCVCDREQRNEAAEDESASSD